MKPAPTSQAVVVTESGVHLELGACIGRGGQGEVWELKGGRRAVKLLVGVPESKRDHLRAQLAYVRRLQDVARTDVVKPLELLQAPSLGYVMELVTGMVPLSALAYPPQHTPSIREWYVAAGGLKRRLRILARVAESLWILHAQGLAYGDPSLSNILISKDPEQDEVRLIDPDNIRAASRPGDVVYTPGFGAPEVVTGRSGVSTLSDAHAFAVIAFQTLSLTHPLIGDAASAGEPELEERALRGELPWIDCPDDQANRSSSGLPRELVLSKLLHDCFLRTFGTGLTNPENRPGLSEWASRLLGASRAVLTCPQCAATYYGLSRHTVQCPFCQAPVPERLEIHLALVRNNRGISSESAQERIDMRVGAVLADLDPIDITHSLLFDEIGPKGREVVMSVKKVGSSVVLQAFAPNVTVLAPGNPQRKNLDLRPHDFPIGSTPLEVAVRQGDAGNEMRITFTRSPRRT